MQRGLAPFISSVHVSSSPQQGCYVSGGSVTGSRKQQDPADQLYLGGPI